MLEDAAALAAPLDAMADEEERYCELLFEGTRYLLEDPDAAGKVLLDAAGRLLPDTAGRLLLPGRLLLDATGRLLLD